MISCGAAVTEVVYDGSAYCAVMSSEYFYRSYDVIRDSAVGGDVFEDADEYVSDPGAV